MPNLFHFAINADDVPRARRFYEGVLGWRFHAWGPPKFYMIDTAAPGETQTVRGSLQGRRELVPGKPTVGFECTVRVPSIDATIAAVVAHGGSVVIPKSVIPGVGALAFFLDTEGNAFAAIEPRDAAPGDDAP